MADKRLHTGMSVAPVGPASGGHGLYDAPINRPPADLMYKEIFFDKKCALDDPGKKKFYEWCIDPISKGRYDTICDGLTGMTGACKVETEFKIISKDGRKLMMVASDFDGASLIDRSQLTDDDDNGSNIRRPGYFAAAGDVGFVASADGVRQVDISYESTTIGSASDATNVTFVTPTSLAPNQTEPPKAASSGDAEFLYKWTCSYGGPNKETNPNYGSNRIDAGEFETIKKFCEQEVYGVPWSMPLWLQLLIILAVILAVVGASIVFWNRWLRRKIYGPAPGEPMSSFSSTSSVSNMGTSAGPSSSLAARNPRGPSGASGAIHSSKSRSQSRGPRSSLRAQVIKLGSVARPSALARQRTLGGPIQPAADHPAPLIPPYNSTRSSSLRRSTQRSISTLNPPAPAPIVSTTIHQPHQSRQKANQDPSLIS